MRFFYNIFILDHYNTASMLLYIHWSFCDLNRIGHVSGDLETVDTSIQTIQKIGQSG